MKHCVPDMRRSGRRFLDIWGRTCRECCTMFETPEEKLDHCDAPGHDAWLMWDREQFLGFNAKYPAVFTKRECQNALDTFEKYKDIKVKWNPRQEPLETSASATISRKNQVTSVWHAKQPASWMIEPDTRLGKSKGNATTAGEVALAHQQAPRLENAEGMMRTKRKSPRVAEEDGDDEYCDMSSKQRVARPRKKAKISRPKEKLRRKGQASNNDDDDYHP